jgi:hypothetical protein
MSGAERIARYRAKHGQISKRAEQARLIEQLRRENAELRKRLRAQGRGRS